MKATEKPVVKFVMPRDRVIATKQGHTIEFKKNQPTHVPRECWPEVQAAGAVPTDEIDEDEAKSKVPTDPTEREELIRMAIEDILVRNQREDFTASGAPHSKVISAKLGFNVDSKERDVVWDKMRKADD